MTITADPKLSESANPAALDLAYPGTVPLFLGALLSDIAYFQTYQIQWSNSSWLIAGGLVFCGLALLFALANLIRADRKVGRPLSTSSY